jgi:hypothetical protein
LQRSGRATRRVGTVPRDTATIDQTSGSPVGQAGLSVADDSGVLFGANHSRPVSARSRP